MHWIFKPGVFIPFVGKRRIPVNRDGTPFDSGERDLLDEKAPFYVEAWVFEWFGMGLPITRQAILMDAKTDAPVDGPPLSSGEPLSDHQLAVRLMALDEEDNFDAWVEKWEPMFGDWGQQDHSGDCTKQPWTCERCVYEDYMGRVPQARRILGIPAE